MSHFEYTAQCKSGASMSGALESEDATKAMEQLTSMGLVNVDLHQGNRPPIRRPLGSGDFIFFNEQLASLAGAGICLDEGLRQLGRDVRSGRLRDVLEAIAGDIERGQALDQALERHASEMPPLYARVVRAGVANGQLPATLLNLSHHLRLVSETRRLIVEALTYPTFVLVLAVAVFCAVVMLIVPQFSDIFADFGVRLPGTTILMIQLSRQMPLLLGCLGAVMLCLSMVFFALRFSDRGRLRRERIILAIPAVGSMIRNSLHARFLRAMAFAVDASVPLPEAIRLSAGATGSPMLIKEADDVATRTEDGLSLEESCGETRLIPPMFGYFLGVGGDAASLRNSLIQLSKASESRAEHAQAMLRGWMPPLAVAVVGLLIAELIVALFLPLVSLLQSVT